jgi:hypothetical protein
MHYQTTPFLSLTSEKQVISPGCEARPTAPIRDPLSRNTRSRRRWSAFVALTLLTIGTIHTQAQTFLFDFGSVANTTVRGPAPDDPLNTWNNVTPEVASSATGQLLKLVTTLNTPTDLNLVIVSPFNGVNENGTLDSLLFPSDATRDSFFGNTELFNNLSNITPIFKLTGLDRAATYNFTFYASRLGVSDNRETGYTVKGTNSGFAALDVANNLENVATVPGIKPDALGEITISLAPTANNNNANHFIYLGVMKVDAVVPQQPIVFTQQPSSQTVNEFQSVTFRAAVQGAPPYFIRWTSNGTLIPDADQFTYTIPSVTADLNGTIYSITVSNLAFSATSSNAVLRVTKDTNGPVLLSAASLDGQTINLTFNEALDPNSVTDGQNYSVNDGKVTLLNAELRPDGRTVALTLTARITGSFTVKVSNVADIVGNKILSGISAAGEVPGRQAPVFLFDFGAGTTTENGPAPDDPANFWNNIPAGIGASATGELPNLVTTQNTPTGLGLVVVSPFNGANENGTLASGLFPSDATRDSLFGNTELFNNLSDITPIFKLTGLDRALTYRFTFYASRLGVTDNRETGYTVKGANSGFAALNVANNITNTVTVSGITPDVSGEIIISLAPTARNNNANHFVYLGVMKMEPILSTAQFLAPTLKNGLVTLNWTGTGKLERASSVFGPWTPITPVPAAPYSEAIVPGASRYFRLNTSP